MRAAYKVTILTPTYNRGYVLKRLYKSLLRQTSKNFSWIIVDDGSNDKTKDIVANFCTDFPLQYIYKPNGGKHTAINWGITYVNTEYTFIVDSDDYLKNNSIELVNIWIENIKNIPNMAGVAGLRVNKDNKVIGRFPAKCEYIDCLNSERGKKHLLGDKAEIYKTDLLKKYPFPVYPNENFIPESVVWNQFAHNGLKVRWYKQPIVVCEYQEDGLTKATKNIEHFKTNYQGYRDDCILNFQVLNFPYNYSAASVFYAKCCKIKCNKQCLDTFHITRAKKVIIKLLGGLRYILGRF